VPFGGTHVNYGTMSAPIDAAGAVDSRPEGLETYRRELTGYCYRMLGSAFEAEDAVQDTLLRAWQASGRFEGRSTVRSWLYRIATNVCLDMLRGRSRRARPMELGPSSPPEKYQFSQMLPEHSWVSPIADSRVIPEDSDPAEIAVARETIRLAFVTALQHLPPRQRAVLILCEVLRWQAAEVADLLGTSVAAVNSALQRARATLAAVPEESRPRRADDDNGELLAQYVEAFERYDVTVLVKLLHEDAIQSMPPVTLWLSGAQTIGAWMVGPGRACEGSRLIPVAACGSAAFAQYRHDPEGGHSPWALQVLDISDGRISGIHTFLDAAALFPLFDLPAHLPGPVVSPDRTPGRTNGS
jgi:RNA polymerase sigma-70 factor, ECF subfamily